MIFYSIKDRFDNLCGRRLTPGSHDPFNARATELLSFWGDSIHNTVTKEYEEIAGNCTDGYLLILSIIEETRWKSSSLDDFCRFMAPSVGSMRSGIRDPHY